MWLILIIYYISNNVSDTTSISATNRHVGNPIIHTNTIPTVSIFFTKLSFLTSDTRSYHRHSSLHQQWQLSSPLSSLPLDKSWRTVNSFPCYSMHVRSNYVIIVCLFCLLLCFPSHEWCCMYFSILMFYLWMFNKKREKPTCEFNLDDLRLFCVKII